MLEYDLHTYKKNVVSHSLDLRPFNIDELIVKGDNFTTLILNGIYSMLSSSHL